MICMLVTVNGKNIEVTNALREYAEKKVAKIAKFFEKSPVGAQVTLSTERGKHIVDITVQVNGLLLRGEDKTNDMYGSIDGAIEKIEHQVHKFKTKINRKLKKENQVVLAPLPTMSANKEREEAEPQIRRTKRFAIKPMSIEEAVMQMDLLGHDFYVFSNSDTEEVNVVYRRKNGDYGLIEPEF
jgi:putative sigma-54 modulation protein